MNKNIVIIGGGAAGFFCAVNIAANSHNYNIIILERTGKLLSKVKISGGGRCNVTNAAQGITEFSKNYPRGEKLLKKSLHNFSAEDTVKWFEDRGVALKTESDGRMFPVSNSSQSIINCLLNEANKYQISIIMNVEVINIIQREDGDFVLSLSNGNAIDATKICIATGGIQKEKQINFLSSLPVKTIPSVPSLFTFNLPGNDICSLQGISLQEVEVKVLTTKLKEKGALMITHWGLSGPVILRLSAWGARILADKKWEFSIMINWLPGYNEETLRSNFYQLRETKASQFMYHKNPFDLPARLWYYLLQQNKIDEQTRWSSLTAKDQNKLIQSLCAMHVSVKGKTTFKEEFVTAGGINLNEIDSQTMMSRNIPNLYFAGEVLDVDGITGGFNFQNAWTTAFVAAKDMAKD